MSRFSWKGNSPCLRNHFFYKIPVSKKKKMICLANTVKKAPRTLNRYSSLSYEINIYTPAFRHFEKKLLMSGFLERNSPCSTHTQEGRDLLPNTRTRSSYDINIYIAFHILRKNCLCKHFLQKSSCEQKKNVICRKYIQLKGTTVVFHTT